MEIISSSTAVAFYECPFELIEFLLPFVVEDTPTHFSQGASAETTAQAPRTGPVLVETEASRARNVCAQKEWTEERGRLSARQGLFDTKSILHDYDEFDLPASLALHDDFLVSLYRSLCARLQRKYKYVGILL